MTRPRVKIALVGPPRAGVSTYARAVSVNLGATHADPLLIVRCRDDETRAALHTRGLPARSARLQFTVTTREGETTDLDVWDLPGETTLAAVSGQAREDASEVLAALSACDVLLLLLPVPEPHEGPTHHALVLVDGLAARLAARSRRPSVAFVLSQADRLEPDERALDARALLAAHGYEGSLAALALEARSTAWFSSSALGLFGSYGDAPHPEGVAEPILWALLQARRTRRRAAARRTVRAALGLVALGSLVFGADTLHFRQRVAATPGTDPAALVAAAAEARSYAEFPLALRRHDATVRASAWTDEAERASWAPVEAARARADHDGALQALERYLSVLPSGRRAAQACALEDELRLERLEAIVGAGDLERVLLVLTRERDRLHGPPARSRVNLMITSVQARLEARDLEVAEAALARARAAGDHQAGIQAVDAFVARHSQSTAAPRLLGARDRLTTELEARSWAALMSSLSRIDDPARRLSILKRHLAAHPEAARLPDARGVLARLEAEVDDATFARAAASRPFSSDCTAEWIRALEDYLAQWPAGRHVTVARELLVEVRALEAVLACVDQRDPDAILEATERALATSRATRDALQRVKRRWSEVDVDLTVLSAHVKDAHWELFSKPDPRVTLRTGGAVFRTRVANDQRHATFYESTRLRLRSGVPVRIELHDMDVFGEALVDEATVAGVRRLDGTVAVGGSQVVLRIDRLEPAGPE